MDDMSVPRCPILQKPSKVFMNTVLPHLRKVVNRNEVRIYKEQVERYMAYEYGKDKKLPFSLPTSDQEYEPLPSLSMAMQRNQNIAQTSYIS
jgi:hypothetical protein